MKFRTSFPRFTLLFLLIYVISGSTSGRADNIEWRVDNPFRLFLDPEFTRSQIELYRSLDEQQKQHPVLSMERLMAKKNGRGWAEKVFTNTCWDARNNRYRFCRGKGKSYIRPDSHKVHVRFTGTFAPGDQCRWTFRNAGKKYRRDKAKSRIVPCDRETAFDVAWPHGGLVSVAVNGTERAREKIKVRDVFIVGIGDSFASGEGNPDDPVQFSASRFVNYGLDPDKRPLNGYPARKGDWRHIGDAAFLREAARWQSRACHRSLYSWQVRTALQLAIEEPHRAVTFVGFACSGSEITVGLFLRYKGNEWDKHPPRLPQLSYVSEELCGRGASTPKDYTTGYTQLGKLPELENMVLNKCYHPVRKIDLLLVSIGGNDVGFSSLVANAIFRDKALLKKVGGWFGSVHGPAESRRLLGVLKTRYTALNKALHYMLRIPWKQSDRVILTAYPRMARQADGRSLCSPDNSGMTLYPDFKVMGRKLREAADFADELYKVMKSAARKHGWTFVDEHREQFAPHGFCAVSPEREGTIPEHLDLPRFVDGKWSGFNPADFQAYASRQRWIRTPDDAYLTGHFHTNGIVSNRLMRYKRSKWFQVVMAGTYSGSFHPTAEGHAAIADAVVRKARKVLQKYGK